MPFQRAVQNFLRFPTVFGWFSTGFRVYVSVRVSGAQMSQNTYRKQKSARCEYTNLISGWRPTHGARLGYLGYLGYLPIWGPKPFPSFFRSHFGPSAQSSA
jgi:hypothetical protein